MVDRLVAVNDDNYRLPEPVRMSLANDVADDGTELGSSLAGAFIKNVIITGTGIDKTGATDSTSSIQAILDAAPSGAAVHFPEGSYRLGAALSISKPLNIVGYGATLTQTTSATACLDITSGSVRVEGLRMVGVQSAATVAGERAIYAHGASAASVIRGIQVVKCSFDTWGQGGVWAQFVGAIEVTDSMATNIRYAGLMFLSCTDGKITKNTVQNVTASQAYGIAMTHLTTTDIATNPRTTDFDVVNNTIINVTSWEGIDTHSGERINITGNTVRDCAIGIAAVGSTIVSTSYAPRNVNILNNTIVGQVGGSGGVGINFVGAGASIGVTTEAATGAIIGNVVRRMGIDAAGQGGIVFYDTQGVSVSGNTLEECVPNAIVAYHDNRGFSITANTITDVWSDLRPRSLAILFRSSHNMGAVSGNSVTRGSRTAAQVNSFAIEVFSDANNIIAIGVNEWSGATGSFVDSGNRATTTLDAANVTVGKAGQKVGFYGATAIVKPAAIPDTATGVVANVETEVNKLKALLRSVGLLTP